MRERIALVVLILTFLLTLALAGVVGIGWVWLYRVAQPSIRYSSTVYTPARSVVCPGDTLDYSVTIFVDRTPAMPVSARSWWSVDLARTVLPDENVTTTVWTDGTPKSITAELNIEVPDLPAGRYEMRTGLRSTGLAVYAVPFNIPVGC